VTGRGDQPIHFRLRIGVTGHRRPEKLGHTGPLEEAIVSVLEKIEEQMGEVLRSPLAYRVVSPLAEGADRIVARTVLDRYDADLVVPLPFPLVDYLEDFHTEESRMEFNELLEEAAHHWATGSNREEGYTRVGREVVNHADVLIALWNGEEAEGPGGTAEVIDHAHPVDGDAVARRIPVFIVRTDKHAQIESRFDGQDWDRICEAYRELDHFNHYRPPTRAFKRAEESSVSELKRPLEGLSGEALERAEKHTDALEEWLPAIFCRADTGATSFRDQVVRIGAGTAFLAAAAVAVAAARAVLWPHLEILTWAELVFIASAVVARIGVWVYNSHRHWIALRALAEKLRDLHYVAVVDNKRFAVVGDVGSQDDRDDRPPIVQLEWHRRAVDEVWKARPTIELQEEDRRWLRALVVGTWIKGQIEYHEKRGREHRRSHVLLHIGVLAAFVGTLVCVLLHLLYGGGDVTVFLAIALPALGGALSYIEGHREHLRHAERYDWTLLRLQELERRGEAAKHILELRVVAHKMLRLMDAENADWAGVMWTHDVELSA
jgi:hypothetical protein